MRPTLLRVSAAALLVAPLYALPATAAAAHPGTDPGAAPAVSAGARTARYLVTLDEGADPDQVLRDTGITPAYVYRDALRGFAADLDRRQVATVLAHPDVRSVERDAGAAAF
ncbi:protease inhibitor I9 family protein [Kitasatospora sp. NPDC094015]|uniref:protease inhibitor I9 family protein n=1 Tax=Kitasatospora sp. NPDC094015 TaxID=3155205 RepID=UPI0033252489